MSILKGTLALSFLLLPTFGAVIGIIVAFRQRSGAPSLRLVVTIFSLAAVVAENIYFIAMFVFLPNGVGPVYTDAMYRQHARLEVFGVRSVLAILPVSFAGTGLGRVIAVGGTIFVFFLWFGVGIWPVR